MNYNLNYEGFEPYLVYGVTEHRITGGAQYLFRFENGYGASVIKHKSSYGFKQDLWELAVVWFYHNPKYDEDRYLVCYPPELDNDDVFGYITDDRVKELLKRIKEL